MATGPIEIDPFIDAENADPLENATVVGSVATRRICARRSTASDPSCGLAGRSRWWSATLSLEAPQKITPE